MIIDVYPRIEVLEIVGLLVLHLKC